MPYRAPELLEVMIGSAVSEATDIWVGGGSVLSQDQHMYSHVVQSLGVMMYAMAIGETPFEGAVRQGTDAATPPETV